MLELTVSDTNTQESLERKNLPQPIGNGIASELSHMIPGKRKNQVDGNHLSLLFSTEYYRAEQGWQRKCRYMTAEHKVYLSLVTDDTVARERE